MKRLFEMFWASNQLHTWENCRTTLIFVFIW